MRFDHLQWPFFAPHYQQLALKVENWATELVLPPSDNNVTACCHALLDAMAKGGITQYTAVDTEGKLSARTIALIREILAYHNPLADFVFALQGLGSAAMALFAYDTYAHYLKDCAAGRLIPAFALSEKDAGSDVASLTTTATPDGEYYLLNGEKAWISNAGIADIYIVFARTGAIADGAKGLSAFVVDADTSGLVVTETVKLMAPHPLGTLQFTDCRIPAKRRIANEGDGFKIAMTVLDIFRPSVGAAALGMARRAFALALAHSRDRTVFGNPLFAQQIIKDYVASMATAIDTSALLVYRAAWSKDVHSARISREAAMAKRTATEAAQRVIDLAMQIHGARAVVADHPLARLYRDIRALRIYEGASEIQQLIIAEHSMRAFASTAS